MAIVREIPVFKSKIKSKKYNKKSLLTKMFPFVITKNLNLEILTKNLLIFKRWDWLRKKNLIIIDVH